MNKYVKSPFLSTSFSDDKAGMKKRFENILNTTAKKRGFIAFIMILAVVAIAGGFIVLKNRPQFVSEGESVNILETKKIENLISAICASPAEASSLTPYIEEHQAEFDELVSMDMKALKYMLGEFEKGGKTGLDGNIMMLACRKILADEDIKFEAANGQEWFNAFKDYVMGVRDNNGEQYVRNTMHKSSIILDIYRERPVKILDAVKYAILDSNKNSYLGGECVGEGHIVLDTADVTDKYNAKQGTNFIEAYVLAMYGEYGFENGIFTKVSGSGIIPTRITFSRNEAGEYSLHEYKEAMDGSYYAKSIKEMFPKKLWDRALRSTDEDRDECKKQEEVYARAYLTFIKREAEVGKVDRVLANMNVRCSNELMDYFYDYPYWIGTEEKIENGIRYVYEKLWNDKGNGDGIVTFKKYEYNSKKVADETIIEIKGENMTYLKGEERVGKGGKA